MRPGLAGALKHGLPPNPEGGRPHGRPRTAAHQAERVREYCARNQSRSELSDKYAREEPWHEKRGLVLLRSPAQRVRSIPFIRHDTPMRVKVVE
jgi:hypothetical protein